MKVPLSLSVAGPSARKQAPAVAAAAGIEVLQVGVSLPKAPMVLLDEPTASLDPRSAAAVIDAIRTATTNRTVLVVTHDRDLAAIADRVVTLSPASRAGQGPPKYRHSNKRKGGEHHAGEHNAAHQADHELG